LTAILSMLSACSTPIQSTTDTFCLTYQPVRMHKAGWGAIEKGLPDVRAVLERHDLLKEVPVDDLTFIERGEPLAYTANQHNNAKHNSCPKP
jgi:hypothetical protein